MVHPTADWSNSPTPSENKFNSRHNISNDDVLYAQCAHIYKLYLIYQ